MIGRVRDWVLRRIAALVAIAPAEAALATSAGAISDPTRNPGQAFIDAPVSKSVLRSLRIQLQPPPASGF